jgi:hypothetical protein
MIPSKFNNFKQFYFGKSNLDEENEERPEWDWLKKK